MGFTNQQDALKEYNKLLDAAIELTKKLNDENSKLLHQSYLQIKNSGKLPTKLADTNAEIARLKVETNQFNLQLKEIAKTTKNFKDEWVDALKNLNKQSREVERVKGYFNNLESIVRDITYHRKGDRILSSQNLTSLARQTLFEKTNLETSKTLLESKKNLSNEEKKTLKNIKDTLNTNSKLYKEQIDHAKRLSKEQNNIERGVGLTTKVLKTTEGLLQKIGLTDLSSTFEDASMGAKTYINKVTLSGTKSANFFQKLKAPLIGIGIIFQDLGKKFKEALLDPMTYFIGAFSLIKNAFSLIKNIIVGVFDLIKNIINSAINFIKNLITEASSAYKEFATLISDEQTNISRSLGVSFQNAQKLHAEVLGMGATAASSIESFLAIQNALGNSDMLSKSTQNFFIKLKEYAGITAENLGKGYQYAKFLGQDSKKFTEEILEQIEIQKDTLGVSVDQREAFKEIVSISTLTKTLLGGSAQAIAKSYTSAKKLGIELDKVLETSKSLLDLDQSLQKEMELFLLTGKQFDFNQMRIFAMTQNVSGLAQMQGQLSQTYLQDAKNNIFVRKTLEEMGYNLIEQENQSIQNAKTENQIKQDALKTAQEQQKSFSEALTNFNRYILGIKSQGGKTFFELGQKIDLFKAKILGGLSGAIGRSVDTFISKNGKAIENLSNKILKLFDKISEKGGILELLLNKIFEFFTGDKIDPNKGIMGGLNKLFDEGGIIDRGLNNLKNILKGTAPAPEWITKTIQVLDALKIIFGKIFDGLIKYADTIIPLTGKTVQDKRETIQTKITQINSELKKPTTPLDQKLLTKYKNDLTKELQSLTPKQGETYADVANRINKDNIKEWEESWLGKKIKDIVDKLTHIAWAVGGFAVLIGGLKTYQILNAIKLTRTAATVNTGLKTAATVNTGLKTATNQRSLQALSQNRVAGKFAKGFKPSPSPPINTLKPSALSKVFNNPFTKAVNGVVNKAFAPLSIVLGGLTGNLQAEQTGRSKTEATILGTLTGTATTGSFLSPYLGIKEGSTKDKVLGFGTSVLQGAAIGAAAGTPFFGIGAVPGAIVGGIAGAIAEGWKLWTEKDRTRALQEKQEKERLAEIEKIKKLNEQTRNKELHLIARNYTDQKLYLDKEFQAKQISQKEYEKHIKNLNAQLTLITGIKQEDVNKIQKYSGLTAETNNDINSVTGRTSNISLAHSKHVRGHYKSAPLFVYVMGGELAVATNPYPNMNDYTKARSKGLYGTEAEDMYSSPTPLKRIVSIGNRKFRISTKDTLLVGNFPNKNASINQVKLAPFGTFKLTNFLPKQNNKTQTNFASSYLQANKTPQTNFLPKPVELKLNFPYSDEDNNTLKEKNTQIFNTPLPSPSTLSFQAVESLSELNKTLIKLTDSMSKPNSTPPISVLVELDKQKVGEFAVKANKNYIASQNSLNYSPYSYG